MTGISSSVAVQPVPVEQDDERGQRDQPEREVDDRRDRLDATGSTSFGNWTWRISRSGAGDRGDRRRRPSVWNHFQGRIAAKMKSG